MKKKTWLFQTLMILAGLLIASSVFLLGLEIANAGRIGWGIKAAGINLGGLKTEAAQKVLAKELNQFQANNFKLALADHNKIWLTDMQSLGLSFDFEKTAAQAYQIGRGKNVLAGLSQQVKAFFGRYNLTLETKINQERFKHFTNLSFAAFENIAQGATLTYNQTTDNFDIQPAKEGLIINRDKLKKDLAETIGRLAFQSIELSLIKDYPQVTAKQAQASRQKILSILADAPYHLTYQDKTWPLAKQTILDWLLFEASSKELEIVFNQEKIEPFLINLAPAINQPSVNAHLALVNDQVIVARPAQDAIELDLEETANQLSDMLLSQSKEMQIAVKLIPAQVRAETLETLGLIDQLGVGSSNFVGSSKSRTHNIKIGMAKFNGYLLKPNEEFSVTTELGDIDASTGYLPEIVIKGKKLVSEYGGGLCQVSTTLFRAAVYTGLEITERYAHAFPVAYYNPQGFDATIYQPHPDLRFINDTPNNILIQGYTTGTKAFFEFYGQSDGRRTELKGPYIYESNADGSMKTVLTQEVYRDNELLRQKKFWSNYKSPSLYPLERNPLE